MKVLVSIMLCLGFGTSFDSQDKPGDLSDIISSIVQKHRLPALGGAVVNSSGLQSIGVAGVRSSQEATKVTTEDRWHIGSCTKTMTATLVARLIDAGKLTWDTTIGDVFAKSIPDLHPQWKNVPIIWLLCHRSGADKNFSDELWQRTMQKKGTTREQRLFFVTEGLKSAPSKTPNTETIYSNAAYIVAAVMLETLADKSWEELMTLELFKPLGMTRSGFGPPGSAGKLDQPLGHKRGPNGWTPLKPSPDADIPVVAAPAGAVHVTLSDWAKFMVAHQRGARGDETFLKKSTWQKLHTEGAKGWGYSPGWVVAKAPWTNGTLLRHMGSNGYWIAEASFAPDRDLAILIVSNLSDDALEPAFKETLDALVATQKPFAK